MPFHKAANLKGYRMKGRKGHQKAKTLGKIGKTRITGEKKLQVFMLAVCLKLADYLN